MTWDYEKFDGVEDFIENLEDKGRNLVTIIDPHIKQDSGYFIYQEAKANSKKLTD
jgi:alpha 1,3-glucosidase